MRGFTRRPLFIGLGLGIALLLLVLSRSEHMAAGEVTDRVRGGYITGVALLLMVGLRVATVRRRVETDGP